MWQRCVLCSPRSDAILPLLGAVAQCRHRLAVCNGIPDAAVVGPLRLPAEAGAGGATRVLAHLEVWAPNMYPWEVEPLPPAAFQPRAWPEDLLDPPPPCTQSRSGGVHPHG